MPRIDQRGGALEYAVRRCGHHGPGKRPRRSYVLGRRIVLREKFGDAGVVLGIEPAIYKAGKVEEALGLVRGNLGIAAAPP